MTTDRDYADMIDPFVRAEEAAEQRGYREGFAAAIFYCIVAIVGLGMLLVALNAHAQELKVEAWMPARASDYNARITVCQANPKPLGPTWLCYCVR